MRLTSDGEVKLPCCETKIGIETFAELVQEFSGEAEEEGRLQITCPECGEKIEIGLKHVDK